VQQSYSIGAQDLKATTRLHPLAARTCSAVATCPIDCRCCARGRTARSGRGVSRSLEEG
jgi:hypothetical protein